MIKHLNRLFTLVAVLGSMASCTLYMDDLEIPEDELGFGEPHTEKIEMDGITGYSTYEYQDDVKALTQNVQQYIHHIDDSIVYYFDSTPSEYVPRVGEKLTMGACPLSVSGLNHKVLSVENANGFIKVTTMPVPYTEVYKQLNSEYDVEIVYPSFIGVDSTDLETEGITEEDMRVVVWDTYNRAMYPEEYKKQRAEAREKATRAGFLNGKSVPQLWQSEPLGPYARNNTKTKATRGEGLYGWKVLDDWYTGGWKENGMKPEARLTLLNLDTRLVKDFWNVAKNNRTWAGLVTGAHDADDEKPATPFVAIKKTMVVKYMIHISVYLQGPKLIVKTKGNYDLTMEDSYEFGVESGNLAEATRKIIADKFKKNPAELKIEPVLPEGLVPLPAVTPAVALYVQPRFSFTANIGGYGKIVKTKPMPAYEVEFNFEMLPQAEIVGALNPFMKPFMWGLQALVCERGKLEARRAKDPIGDENLEVEFGGTVGASVSAGFEVGLEICKWVNLGIYSDLVGSANVNVNYTPFTNNEWTGSQYFPEKNYINLGLNIKGGVTLGTGFKAKSSTQKKFDYEFVDVPLVDWKIYFRPVLSSFEATAFEYDSNTTLLKFCDCKFKVSSTGWFSKYNSNIQFVIVAKPKNGGKTLYFEGDVIDKLQKGKEYTVMCDFLLKNHADYDLSPAIKVLSGDEEELLLLGGYSAEAMGTQGGRDVKNLTATQTFGNKVSQLSSTMRSALKKKFGSEVKNWYIYGVVLETQVTGGTNIKEWGYEVNLSYDSGFGNMDYDVDVPIQRIGDGTKEIKSGKKTVDIYFVDPLSPDDLGAMPYILNIYPYSVNNEGKRKVHNNCKIVYIMYPHRNAKQVEEEMNKRTQNKGIVVSF